MSLHQLILASESPTRRELLDNAGVEFSAIASNADEPAIRSAFLADNAEVSCADLALVLAAAKAELVSERFSDATVIGADQVLEFDGHVLNKVSSMADARDRLLRMRAATHSLHSAVCCVRNGRLVWSHTDSAHLTMRDFSARFLGQHLAAVGEQVLGSVGCYQLEGRGIQLFEKIEGDYFTILGLPLLPLLSFLRSQDLVPGE